MTNVLPFPRKPARTEAERAFQIVRERKHAELRGEPLSMKFIREEVTQRQWDEAIRFYASKEERV